MFQCLVIEGENAGDDALRNAERFVVTDEQFQSFVDRHSSVSCLVPESNSKMRYSYLIVDEYVSSQRLLLAGGTRSCSERLILKRILIHDLLFLPISTIESAVGKRLITHCCVSRLACSRLSGHIEPHSPRLQA